MSSAPTYIKARIFILFAATGFVVLCSLASIAWIWKTHQKPSLTEQVLEHSRMTASTEPQAFQFSYEIKDMSIAFLNKKGSRTAYSQFTIIFDCPTEDSKRTMELNRAKIINGIFEVGGDFYIDDFQAPKAAEGFDKFKKGIAARLAEYFPKHAPRSVLIKEWVMN